MKESQGLETWSCWRHASRLVLLCVSSSGLGVVDDAWTPRKPYGDEGVRCVYTVFTDWALHFWWYM